MEACDFDLQVVNARPVKMVPASPASDGQEDAEAARWVEVRNLTRRLIVDSLFPVAVLVAVMADSVLQQGRCSTARLCRRDHCCALGGVGEGEVVAAWLLAQLDIVVGVSQPP